MEKNDINEYIAEKILKEPCYHIGVFKCTKCGFKSLDPVKIYNPDYYTWQGFSILWTWCVSNCKLKELIAFVKAKGMYNSKGKADYQILATLVDPEKLAFVVYYTCNHVK